MITTPVLTDGFMKDDVRILRRFARVVPFETSTWNQSGRRGRILLALALFWRFARMLVREHIEAVIFWFVTIPFDPFLALIARLLGRKVVLITGGADAVYVPDIDWGAMKDRAHRWGYWSAVRLAHSVLPFSDYAASLIARRDRPAHLRTVYPAIDTSFFRPGDGPIAPRVVTSCYAVTTHNIVQKGLDVFVEAARRLPEVQFAITGAESSAAVEQLHAPANVQFVARMRAKTAYRDFLQSSAVYAQLSAYEGFGVSLGEAMATGCIPIVSDRGSLPEVVGDCGFVVPYHDVEATVAAAREAVERGRLKDDKSREQSRARTVTLFDESARQHLLHEELARLVPALRTKVTRIELGCGDNAQYGVIGVDQRRTSQTRALCDVRRACFRSGVADEVYSFCVLEHMDDPYELLDEVVRLLKPEGQAVLRVPNLGTYSAHLDTTHRFLADLSLWKTILGGYFEEVRVIPVGTKYRDSRLLVAINAFLVRGLRFHELAQGWTFVCRVKRPEPVHRYTGWWQERR